MLEQTKNTIALLKSCGLRRDEFSVTAKTKTRTHKGFRHVEYTGLDIVLYGANARRPEIAERLAEHFAVSVICQNGEPLTVLVNVPGREDSGVPGFDFEYMQGLYRYERTDKNANTGLRIVTKASSNT